MHPRLGQILIALYVNMKQVATLYLDEPEADIVRFTAGTIFPLALKLVLP